MERVERDDTPAEEWLQSLNATCNRLSTQYLNILRSASTRSHGAAESDGSGGGRSDILSGSGGRMMSAEDPPPPPLAADLALSMVQCQLAAENISVASSHLITLIRTLRLSLLLMDEETIHAEEQVEIERTQQLTCNALKEAAELEQLYMERENIALHE